MAEIGKEMKAAQPPPLIPKKSVGPLVAVSETVILLHPPFSLVGVSIRMERECQENDGLADG